MEVICVLHTRKQGRDKPLPLLLLLFHNSGWLVTHTNADVDTEEAQVFVLGFFRGSTNG